jgi:hypothetical protein
MGKNGKALQDRRENSPGTDPVRRSGKDNIHPPNPLKDVEVRALSGFILNNEPVADDDPGEHQERLRQISELLCPYGLQDQPECRIILYFLLRDERIAVCKPSKPNKGGRPVKFDEDAILAELNQVVGMDEWPPTLKNSAFLVAIDGPILACGDKPCRKASERWTAWDVLAFWYFVERRESEGSTQDAIAGELHMSLPAFRRRLSEVRGLFHRKMIGINNLGG